MRLTSKTTGYLVAISSFVAACSNPSEAPKGPPTTPSTSAITSRATPQVTTVPKAPEIPTWRLHEKADDFTKQSYSYATLQSSNMIQFGAPYDGLQHAYLFVRPNHYSGTHELYYEISLEIERGQFLCGFDGCVIKFRLDDNVFDTWRARPLKDGSTNAIDLGYRDGGDSFDPMNAGCMYIEFLRFKSLVIQAPFFQEGTKNLEFNIAGLDKLNFPTPDRQAAKQCYERIKRTASSHGH